ncbi:MAG TPA: glycosyltransferase family A protein [Vicinamibacteria bacterium]|nr:glycosyltransferase family A protein [Vicinamibacteria bacterium]
MNQPMVSVVVPAYNAERTVTAAVSSALQQTVSSLEVVVVDDGSRDATLETARRIHDPRVRVVSQENRGAAAARNRGILAATGEYVAFLDADDLWLPRKLARQLEVLSNHPACQACQCGAYFVDDALSVLSVRPSRDTGRSLEEALLFENLPAFLSALIAKRSLLLEVGLFDVGLEILEEWDMAIKMARFGAMRSVPEALVLYRVHPGNRHRNVDIHIAPGFAVLEKVFGDPALPAAAKRLRRRAYATFFRTLAGGYFNNRNLLAFARWALRSVLSDPRQLAYMLALPLRRIERRASRGASGVPANARDLLVP